jgi:hypothetical protein
VSAPKLSTEREAAALLFVVPMPPPLSNASGASRGWKSVHFKKVGYQKALDTLQNVGKVPPPPAQPFARAAVSSVMYLGNTMDTDNSMIRHKWILDWLETRGYVGNDRHLRWLDFPRQVVKRGQDYRIELTLTAEPTP